jgi:predicted PurR-regulated permease PerM
MQGHSLSGIFSPPELATPLRPAYAIPHDGPSPTTPSASPAQRANIELHLVCISLVFIAVVCFGYLVCFLEPVLKPFVFAGFLAYLLSPAVEILTAPFSPKLVLHKFLGGVPPHKPERVRDDSEEEDILGGPRARANSRAARVGGLVPGTVACPHSLAVITVLLLTCLLLFVYVNLVVGSVASIEEKFPKYKAQAIELIQLARTALGSGSAFSKTLKSVHHSLGAPSVEFSAVPAAWLARWVQEIPITTYVMAFASTILAALETTAIVLLFAVFLMMGKSSQQANRGATGAGMLESGVDGAERDGVSLGEKIDRQIRKYIVLKSALSLLLAVAVGISLALLSVDLAFLFATVSFFANVREAALRASVRACLLCDSACLFIRWVGLSVPLTACTRHHTRARLSRHACSLPAALLPAPLPPSTPPIVSRTPAFQFVPNVGAVVATLLPLPVVLLDPGLTWMACSLAILLPLLIHVIVGSVIEPKVFGKGLALHPVVVLFTVLLWALLWGVGGMIVSVPLTAVLRIVLKEVHHPYARLAVGILEGRWMPANAPGVLRRDRSRSNSAVSE